MLIRRTAKALLLPAIAVGVLVAGAPAALANHVAGATYTGSVDGEGSIEIQVSGDGSAVDLFVAGGFPTTCGVPNGATEDGPFPISTTGDHAFGNGTSTIGIRFSGSFPAFEEARGTLVYAPNLGCTSAPEQWTAYVNHPFVPPKKKCKKGFVKKKTKSGKVKCVKKKKRGGR